MKHLKRVNCNEKYLIFGLSFEIPFNTINIGVINGGTSICTTPDYTKVLLGFRITKEANDITYIKKYIDSLINKYNKVEYKIINEIKPFYNEDSIIKENHSLLLVKLVL